MEAKFVWKGHKSGTTVLYILARYVALSQVLVECIANNITWTSNRVRMLLSPSDVTTF